jgi:hypothetical protein
MKIMPFLAVSVMMLSATLPSHARAESWPELNPLVKSSLLIVHCRAEQHEGQKYYQVVHVWKGEYSPSSFKIKPPTGFIALNPDADPPIGREYILFYVAHNHGDPNALGHPDMVLKIAEKSVSYPPEGELPETREYSLERFRMAIGEIVEATSGAVADGQPKATGLPDLSGKWRMFLPAGFEHEITLTRVGDNRYRLEPRVLNFAGVYELDDQNFTIVEPKEPRLAGFQWQMRSEYLLTLVGQSDKTGADYLGAILFRSRETLLR